MSAAVENCLQNVALAVSAEYNEELYQLQGHRLSTSQFRQLIINRQVLMVIAVMYVMRKGNKMREEVLSLPVLSAHKDALIPLSLVGFCHKLKCWQ